MMIDPKGDQKRNEEEEGPQRVNSMADFLKDDTKGNNSQRLTKDAPKGGHNRSTPVGRVIDLSNAGDNVSGANISHDPRGQHQMGVQSEK